MEIRKLLVFFFFFFLNLLLNLLFPANFKEDSVLLLAKRKLLLYKPVHGLNSLNIASHSPGHGNSLSYPKIMWQQQPWVVFFSDPYLFWAQGASQVSSNGAKKISPDVNHSWPMCTFSLMHLNAKVIGLFPLEQTEWYSSFLSCDINISSQASIHFPIWETRYETLGVQALQGSLFWFAKPPTF